MEPVLGTKESPDAGLRREKVQDKFFISRPQYITHPRKIQVRKRKNAATDCSATAKESYCVN